jgi:5-methylcytosine-specific restriction enzyme A
VPMKPARPCAVPMCPAAVYGPNSRCPQHEREQKRRYNQARPPELKRFYSGAAWKAFRAMVKAARPTCECMDPGCRHLNWENRCARPSFAVDHIVEPMTDWSRALDETNVRALCESCHNSKTARTQWSRGGGR